jgi:SAM-dependent methyltransferase
MFKGHSPSFSGDLREPEAMIKLDPAYLYLLDRCFDVIICIHVLAHISNDQRALQEMLWVLRRGGVALIMTPARWDQKTTYEDPYIIDSRSREKAYGEWDFVRK